MARGYVAIKERARRNQEVAAVKGDYFPGRTDLSSTWNADEKGWKKLYTKAEREWARKQEEQARDIFFERVVAVFAEHDKKRGYVAKRLGRPKDNRRSA